MQTVNVNILYLASFSKHKHFLKKTHCKNVNISCVVLRAKRSFEEKHCKNVNTLCVAKEASASANMTNHQATYDWAMPIENRFQLMSHTGAMQYYGDKGNIVDTFQKELVFFDGYIEFSDDMRSMVVKAKPSSKAVFLLQFRNTIVAALGLSKDRGLLIKHLSADGGRLPIEYKNLTVALVLLPDTEPFAGYIRAKSLQDDMVDQSGPISIRSLQNPGIFVPEGMMVMYQHLRNVERAGKRPINKHTFAEHELSPHTNQYRQKNIGNLSKFFTADEGLRWLEFSRNNTPIETALRAAFIYGTREQSKIITYPKILRDSKSGSWKNIMGNPMMFFQKPN